MPSVDLNADMGESFGPWKMGDDESLLKIITSANIACGFHAGDPDLMASTMKLAAENDVGIGAHPGFPDLQGFGRRNMKLPHDNLRNLVRYQLGAAIGMVTAVGTKVRHLKLHGALANMCSADIEMAHACYQGALDVDPDIIVSNCPSCIAKIRKEMGGDFRVCHPIELIAGFIEGKRSHGPDD